MGLCAALNKDDYVIVGKDIIIQCIQVRKNQVRLRITAPEELSIIRYDKLGNKLTGRNKSKEEIDQ
jgi:carbon storage regulator CsrA